MKQWSDYGMCYAFNFLKRYSIAASETLRLVVVILRVSCRWTILLIFLLFFIIVEMFLSMHINIISRVVCPHRIIESVAINSRIEDAERNNCCLCDRAGSWRQSAYAWICCWTVIDYNFFPSQPRRASWRIAWLGSRLGTFAWSCTSQGFVCSSSVRGAPLIASSKNRSIWLSSRFHTTNGISIEFRTASSAKFCTSSETKSGPNSRDQFLLLFDTEKIMLSKVGKRGRKIGEW